MKMDDWVQLQVPSPLSKMPAEPEEDTKNDRLSHGANEFSSGRVKLRLMSRLSRICGGHTVRDFRGCRCGWCRLVGR
ncbi:hypothetical protein SBA3_2640029 [Candidatus Sulfopaludibacter sp. SbA3]|nr:hypothetical protein SBA3_2640029 [Candidatus Sulfopaludibacter sp. SbA3]